MATDELEQIETSLVEHSSGLRVLLAPPSPEMAELVTPDHASRIVATLRSAYDVVVIDCSPLLQDLTIAFLDQSDVVMTVLTLEITNIKNIRQFLALVEQFGYPDGKVQLLVNRADSDYGIRLPDVETSIGRKITHTVASDSRTVVYALNRGVPFVVAAPQARVSEDITRIVRKVVGEQKTEEEAEEPVRAAPRKGLFQWRTH
jgi:pilus assembly protein CpaE